MLEDQTLKVEYRPEVILRSGDNIRLSHRQRPENDVTKRHLPSRIVTPDPYANLDTLTARYVEREVDVDGVDARSLRLKTRRAELSPGISVDQKRVPGSLW